MDHLLIAPCDGLSEIGLLRHGPPKLMRRAPLQHGQHISARDTRSKKAVWLYFSDVGDLVTDGRNLADGCLESLFRVLCLAESDTGYRPDVRS